MVQMWKQAKRIKSGPQSIANAYNLLNALKYYITPYYCDNIFFEIVFNTQFVHKKYN